MADCDDIENGMKTIPHYIYFWENRFDGTMYVGSGRNRRYLTHVANSSNANLKQAIKVDGVENFEYGIFQYYDTELEARLAEQYWFDYLQEMGVKLYNIATKVVLFCGNVRKFDDDTEKQIYSDYVAGDTSYVLGKKYSCDPTTICNILKRHGIQLKPSGRRQGSKASDVTKKKQSESMKGRIITPEHRQKISESSMGKPGTNTGKTFDDEWRKNQAKALVGKERTQTQRFTGDEALDICALYDLFKYKVSEIAKVYDCYGNVINAVLVRNGIQIRPSRQAENKALKKFSAEVEKQIYDEYKKLGNYSTVAKVAGCSKSIARSIVMRYNKETNDQ